MKTVVNSASDSKHAPKAHARALVGMVRACFAIPCLMALSACVTERTVTDGSGRVIYQDTEAHSPFESERQKQREVQDREQQLGLDGTAI